MKKQIYDFFQYDNYFSTFFIFHDYSKSFFIIFALWIIFGTGINICFYNEVFIYNQKLNRRCIGRRGAHFSLS